MFVASPASVAADHRISATKNIKLIERLSMVIAINFLMVLKCYVYCYSVQEPELKMSEEVKKFCTLFSVCCGFLLSSMTLCQHKFDLENGKVKNRKKATVIGAVLQISLVDIFSLVLRLLCSSCNLLGQKRNLDYDLCH